MTGNDVLISETKSISGSTSVRSLERSPDVHRGRTPCAFQEQIFRKCFLPSIGLFGEVDCTFHSPELSFHELSPATLFWRRVFTKFHSSRDPFGKKGPIAIRTTSESIIFVNNGKRGTDFSRDVIEPLRHSADCMGVLSRKERMDRFTRDKSFFINRIPEFGTRVNNVRTESIISSRRAVHFSVGSNHPGLETTSANTPQATCRRRTKRSCPNPSLID